MENLEYFLEPKIIFRKKENVVEKNQICSRKFEEKNASVNLLNNWIFFFYFFSIVLSQKPIGNIYDNLFLFIILVIISLLQKKVIYGFELGTTVQHLSASCCQGIKEDENINKNLYI